MIGWTAKLTTAASGSPFARSTRITVTESSTGFSRWTRLPERPGAWPTAEPMRAGSSRLLRGVDGARELVAEQLRVPLERGDVGQPADRRAAREARRAVVVARVHGDGLGRDAGQRGDALAHRGRELDAREDEVGGDDRGRALAVGEHERLRDQRLLHALRERPPRGPARDGRAERRRDVDPRDARREGS